MVPGALSTVIPFFAARPLRGRTCASIPIGSSINKPVPTILRSKGFRVLASDNYSDNLEGYAKE